MEYKTFAINLANQAGKIMRANFNLGMKKEWKKDFTPVTATDIKINKLVINQVKKYFPTHGVLGEEESYNVKGKEYLWVVDPVDGTVPFSHGFPTFVFSLALVKNGVPIVGVINDPIMKRLVWAEKGKGAFLNGKRTKVSKNSSLKKSVVAVGDKMPKAITYLEKKKAFNVNLYSYVYEAMLVAIGEISGAFYTYGFAHDGAAAKIIVEEAGGKATDLNGNDQRYDRKINGQLVSNGLLHRKLILLNQKYRA